MTRLLLLAPLFAFALLPGGPTAAAEPDKALKKVEAKFEPAEAKPGQTVTFKLTVELNPGYHTYPTVQPEKASASFVNVFKFPEPGAVVFVGTTIDPKDFKTKEEPDVGAKEMRVMTGTVVFTRKAVVSPKAAAGAATVKLPNFKLSVCDANTCFQKKADVEATLKVLDGPAVPVEKDYAEEVTKALNGK